MHCIRILFVLGLTSCTSPKKNDTTSSSQGDQTDTSGLETEQESAITTPNNFSVLLEQKIELFPTQKQAIQDREGILI